MGAAMLFPASSPALSRDWRLPQLERAQERVFEHVIAERPFQLDCTYAAHDAEGLALPAWNGLPASIYVKPWVCERIDHRYGSERQPVGLSALAKALLVLTHESVHVSDFAGARDEALTECQALQLVATVARALGSSPAEARALGKAALVHHASLLARYAPHYTATGCYDDGALDIHPDSHDWPN